MSTVLFRPDIKFRHKLFLTTGVSGVIALAGSIAVGILIGGTLEARDGIAGGAFVGFIVAVLINLVWLMPVLLLIPSYYRSLRYEIHDDEVIVHAGVITKTVKHVPFRTVTNLEVKQGLFDRLFGIGTLNIQTAGMGGSSAAGESLGGLRNFQEVYEQVAAELRRYRAAMAPTQA